MFKHKRLAAIMLSLMMLVALIPAMAFAAENGSGGENAEQTVKVKVNDGGSSFDVKLGEELKLQSAVSGADAGTYHIHWAKTNVKKKTNFVKNGKEIPDDMIASDKITVKGIEAGEAEITVYVVSGQMHENCSGSILVEKLLKINVKDETVKDKYEYGAQGKNLDEQSVEMIAPADITQLHPNADGQAVDYYMNKIEKAFSADKTIAFTFKMSSGMGGQYNEAAFIENAVAKIAVYEEKDENKANPLVTYQKGNLKFLGRNALDRSVTVQIEAGTLPSGNYILVFDQDLCTKNGAAKLGVNVNFQFAVKAQAADSVVPGEEDGNPGQETAPGNSSGLQNGNENGSADETAVAKTVETGDDMNVWVWAAIMIAAMCCAAAVIFCRRRER